jgi:hypothetical protein
MLAIRIGVAALLGGLVLAAFSLAINRAAAPDFQRIAISFVSGVLYIGVLTPLATRLPPRRVIRLTSLFVTLYVTGTLTDLIEAYFFTALLTPVTLVAALLIGLLPALAVSLVVAVLVPTTHPGDEQPNRHRSIASWAWRLLVAGLLYVPAYYGFSTLVAPIEHPFYSDPAFVAQLQTRVPPDSVTIPLETLRGALFALALVPTLRVMPSHSWATLTYLTLIGVVIEAIVPLLGLVTWPLPMRLGNFAELTGDALVRAAVALLLLAFPPLLDDREVWPNPLRRLLLRI